MNRAQVARREQARRALAFESLIDFCAYVDPDAALGGARDTFIENRYRAAHLCKIAEYVERAVDGTLWNGVEGSGKRVLLITTPPGHWKSSLVSRKFPAWYIGRNFTRNLAHQVILTSYNSSLAEANNRAVLELVRDNPLYKNVFDVRVSRWSQSAEEWAIEGEPFPACVAGGVGGGLTGRHGLIVVDDPIRDRSQANSPTYIQTLWDWWVDVVRTRPSSQEFILGIWTRWTENDPAGRLLAGRMKGENDERIVYLRLPALAETDGERRSVAGMGLPVDTADPMGRAPGDALWPEKETSDEHRATRRAFPLTFDSLYQGRPRPHGGFVVGRLAFKNIPMPSRDVRWVLGVDWAFTEKHLAPKHNNDPDYTAVALVGLWTPAGNVDDARIVIGSVGRVQANQHDARQFVKGQMQAVGNRVPVRSAQDGIDKLFLDAMRRDTELIGHSIRNIGHIAGDKLTRAAPWLEMAHAGLVYLVIGNWNEEFLTSVERFPHGAHDDMEDAISVAVHALGLGQRKREATSTRFAFYGQRVGL